MQSIFDAFAYSTHFQSLDLVRTIQIFNPDFKWKNITFEIMINSLILIQRPQICRLFEYVKLLTIGKLNSYISIFLIHNQYRMTDLASAPNSFK